MIRFPLLEIDCGIIKKNAELFYKLCKDNGIEPFAVIKGFNGDLKITAAILQAGFRTVASSRLPHLGAVKAAGYDVKTLVLRLPMLSEVDEVVAAADISLNSEKETLCRLNNAAKAMNKIHNVILMRDLGDLREGVFESETLVELAVYVEKELSSLHLLGIGSNLSCYGSVIPTEKNLSLLAADAEEIERAIMRPLEIVSGGATTSLPLMVRGVLPRKINNLRIGTCLFYPEGLRRNWDTPIDGTLDNAITLTAEIIEIGYKPTHPIGELRMDCFGHRRKYEDLGIRKRALLGIGAFDVADCSMLIPCDSGVRILGASSDHMIIDINDSKNLYKLGDKITFKLLYEAVLFTTNSPLIAKKYK